MSGAMSVRELSSLTDAEMARLLDRREWNDPQTLATCAAICDAVRERGDEALFEFCARFDGYDARTRGLRVPARTIDAAADGVDADVRSALDLSLRNIERFHETQRPPEFEMVRVADGIRCGERATPIDAVCLYVPRGRGAFSSVACMLGVPARMAGVPRIVICTPPGPDGSVDPATLYVASRLGIDEIYTVGGAQALAAVAWGTETIPRCDKVVGPGNVFVAGARQVLASIIDTGSPAGPSESLIVADGTAIPENVAWNLMIEAEHGENSWAVLVTHDRAEARAVAQAVESQRDVLTPDRRAYVDRVLSERGGILITESLEASVEFANRFAAEHAALMVEDPWTVLPRLRHAGEILLGDFPIMSLANYSMGINAILPTGGLARSFSGVSVRDFVKYTSIGEVTATGFDALRRIVPRLSRDEGFSAHHEAILRWRSPVNELSVSEESES